MEGMPCTSPEPYGELRHKVEVSHRDDERSNCPVFGGTGFLVGASSGVSGKMGFPFGLHQGVRIGGDAKCLTKIVCFSFVSPSSLSA